MIAGYIRSVHQRQEVWLLRGSGHVWFAIGHCASEISYKSRTKQRHQPGL